MKLRKSRVRRPKTKPSKVRNKKEPTKAPLHKPSAPAKEPDFVERFLKFIEETPFKLPRGKSGRPDQNQRNWQEECFNLRYLALASYYGGCPSASDYDLCIAWARARNQGPDSEEAKSVILAKVRRAIDEQDETIPLKLLHACRVFAEQRPKFPLVFALVRARLVLRRKGHKAPSKAVLVKEAMSYFREQPVKAEQFESLEKSLFRKAEEIYEALVR